MQPAQTAAARPKRRRRTDLTLSQKVEIDRLRRSGVELKDIADDFGIHPSSIRRIRRNLRDMSLTVSSTLQDGTQARKRPRTSPPHVVDTEPVEWNTSADATEIVEHSIKDEAESGWPASPASGSSAETSGSDGYEQRPAQPQFATVFLTDFEDLVEEYGLENIYNLAETWLCWRSLPFKAVLRGRGPMAVGAEVLGDRVTLGLCANAAGTHRLPLLFVGRYKDPRCFKGSPENLPVFYHWNSIAGLAQQGFTDWVQSCFVPQVEKYQLSTEAPSRVLLLVENGGGHLSPEVLRSERVDVRALPPGSAAHLQPMKLGPINKFKEAFLGRLVRRASAFSSASDFYRCYDLRDCAHLAAEAWAELSEWTLRSAWTRLVPVLRLETADEAATSNNPDETLAGLTRLLRRLAADITVDDVKEWQQQLKVIESVDVPGYDEEKPGSMVDPSDDDDALVVANAFAVLEKWASKKSKKVKLQFDDLLKTFTD